MRAANDHGALALRLLMSLAQSNYPLSADDLARENDSPLLAVKQALKVLLSSAFAACDGASGHYVIGPKFIRISHQAQAQYPLDEAKPVLQQLAAHIRETVTLNTYTAPAADCVCVMVEESPAPLHYAVEIGERKPLHAGSSGRAILAHFSDEQIQWYIDATGLPQVTSKTTNDPAKLWRELRLIRKQGIAISKGQRLKGAVAVGGSVFGLNNKIRASVVATIPLERYRLIDREPVFAAVRQAAHRLSAIFESWEAR